MIKSIRKYVILSFQIDDQQVPLALQLRFQAELNQMESIQEAERQLHQINQMRDVVTARNETAIYAQVRRKVKLLSKKQWPIFFFIFYRHLYLKTK